MFARCCYKEIAGSGLALRRLDSTDLEGTERVLVAAHMTAPHRVDAEVEKTEPRAHGFGGSLAGRSSPRFGEPAIDRAPPSRQAPIDEPKWHYEGRSLIYCGTVPFSVRSLDDWPRCVSHADALRCATSTMIKPSIAVVDDDEPVRESTTNLLRSLGIIAKAFASGREFLQSNRVRITSCLIADMQMPDMSGLELYGRLAALGTPIPIILITAYPDGGLRVRALNAAIIGYLTKPFSKKEFVDSVNAAGKQLAFILPVKVGL